MFSRFDTNHACDGRTDGQTDGIGVAYTRYSIYAVARKNFKELEKALVWRHLRQARARPSAGRTPTRRAPAIAPGGRTRTNTTYDI